MISRRAVLTGGAVVGVGAVGTVGAVRVIGLKRVMTMLGLRDSPDHVPPASGWNVEERTLASAAMGTDVPWLIAVPPRPPVGIIIALHGRGETYRYAFDQIRLHDMAAEAGLDAVVVSVEGGDHQFWHARADGTDADALVIDELLPAVDEIVGVGLPRALLGWSMGAWGALLMGQRATDRLVAVVAASPALWDSFAQAREGAFDDEADFQAHDLFREVDALAPLVVRIDCGAWDDEFVGISKRLAAQLPNPNPGGFTDGNHDTAYWRSLAPAQMATIAAAFAAT